jgi:uncharacterized protein YoxC
MSPAVEVLNIISVCVQIILFVAFIVLIVALNKYIKGLMTKIEYLQKDVNAFKVRLEPLIDDSLQLVKKLNSISDKVDDNIDVIKKTVLKVRDATDKIIEFEQNLQNKIEGPVVDTINTYSAVVKGIKTFIERFRFGKRSDIRGYSGSESDEINFDTEEKPVEVKNNKFEEDFNEINKELNDVRKKLEEMKKV